MKDFSQLVFNGLTNKPRRVYRLVMCFTISDNREIVVDPTHQFPVPFFTLSKEIVEVTKTIIRILEVLFYLRE